MASWQSPGGARPKARPTSTRYGGRQREKSPDNWRSGGQESGKETRYDWRGAGSKQRVGYTIPTARTDEISERNWRDAGVADPNRSPVHKQNVPLSTTGRFRHGVDPEWHYDEELCSEPRDAGASSENWREEPPVESEGQKSFGTADTWRLLDKDRDYEGPSRTSETEDTELASAKERDSGSGRNFEVQWRRGNMDDFNSGSTVHPSTTQTSNELTVADLEMLRNSSVGDILNFLNSNRKKLRTFLDVPPELGTSENFLGVISKVIRSDTYVKDIEELMSHLAKSLLFFPSVVAMFNSGVTAEMSRAIYDTLLIMRYLLSSLPAISYEMVMVLLPKIELLLKKRGIEKESDLFVEMQKVKLLLEATLERIIAGDTLEDDDTSEDYTQFLNMSILPMISDIGPNSKPPDLAENIVRGRYRNGLHYLSTQFCLLREDLLAPLRCCIKQYRENQAIRKKVSKLDEGYCYNDVRLLNFETGPNGLGCRLEFDASRLEKVNWDKRLLHGNLVLLSSDGFDTFFCATVLKREEKYLLKGNVTVAIEHGFLAFAGSWKTMAMIEGSSFLPAYQFVLRRLQALGDLSSDGQDIPFQRYLVKCHKDIKAPAYLNGNSMIDFSKISLKYMKQSEHYDVLMYKTQKIDVTDHSSWDNLSGKGLESSQLDALRSMFTNELCVIQGPPGTGKTFIGLRFVEILLANRKVWKPDNGHGKIMVVCLTNHALDQFLEGIVDLYGISDGSGQDVGLHDINRFKVVRIGGNCKNEKLQRYTLVEQRKLAGNKDIRRRLWEIYEQLELLGYCFHTTRVQIKPSQVKVSDVLSKVPPKHLNGLRNSGLEIVKALMIWLEGRSLTDAVRYQEEDNNIEEDNEGWGVARQGHNRRTRFQTGAPSMLPFATRRHLDRTAPMSQSEADSINDVWELPVNARRALYVQWALIVMEGPSYEEVTLLQTELEEFCREMDQIRALTNFRVVNTAEIIGITTTGAAKYYDLIKKVKPTIVIVEEAAEVLEAHIVTALTENCEQLILIGDHKQLRPNPTTYRLAREYNLDISLFERMVRNKLPVSTLAFQHRMRPEISQFLVPHIYATLNDHEEVTQLPDILGVQGNVVFFNHDKPEEGEDERRSHSNLYEAEMVVGLCAYLLKQGYKESQITILTMYTGQVFQINERLEKLDYSGVRVVPVDNFQGEENDIILMSFVRSNNGRKIGFLKASNRICVSLSRAKRGLYCVGNFNMYANVNVLWRDLVQDFKSKGVLQDHFSLVCLNHSTTTRVAEPGDFKKVPSGGCALPCGRRLDCGHTCSLSCHPCDPGHKEFLCYKPCEKKCKNGHLGCNLVCHEDCKPCRFSVSVEKEECGHKYNTECAKADGPCSMPCERLLSCGHVCRNVCGLPCTEEKQCKTQVTVEKPCGHTYETDCGKKDFPCALPCKKKLECGHLCENKCGDECAVRCMQPCLKKRTCGHDCNLKCYEFCAYGGPCKETVQRVLPCSHAVDILCCDMNKPIQCKEKITVKLDCGHEIVITCHKNKEDYRFQCTVKEEFALPCGHIGTRECRQSQTDAEGSALCEARVLVELDCGHRQEVACHAAAKGTCVCNAVVERALPCGHIAAIECCVDPATTVCHITCSTRLKCGHFCQGTCSSCCLVHTQCQLPCQKLLLCSHPCQGICGETCLPCDQDTEVHCSHGILGYMKCTTRKVFGSCRKQCAWECVHHRCTRACYEKCDRPVCDEPCQKRLRCGHPCMGLCGELCPNVCFRCNQNLGKMLGGKVARFISLRPCGHNIPVTKMDKLMECTSGEGVQEVQVKCCPRERCGRPILFCPRYKNAIMDYTYVMLRENAINSGSCRDKPVALSCFENMTEYRAALETALSGTESYLTLADFSDILLTLTSRLAQKATSFGHTEMDIIKTLVECSLLHLELMKETGSCGLCLKPLSQGCDCLLPARRFKSMSGDDRAKLVELRKQYSKTVYTTELSPMSRDPVEEHKWYRCPNGHFLHLRESDAVTSCKKCATGSAGNELERELRRQNVRDLQDRVQERHFGGDVDRRNNDVVRARVPADIVELFGAYDYADFLEA
ncbi:NFX1-type zinc finger-containing protein 1-like [Lineus longissimus]|uniref:NFX1-type zinc finger-containing protein 1-like n=1 Tax=Lineus longissimus TaxID=88925 RepID=UPI00315DEFBC